MIPFSPVRYDKTAFVNLFYKHLRFPSHYGRILAAYPYPIEGQQRRGKDYNRESSCSILLIMGKGEDVDLDFITL